MGCCVYRQTYLLNSLMINISNYDCGGLSLIFLKIDKKVMTNVQAQYNFAADVILLLLSIILSLFTVNFMRANLSSSEDLHKIQF